MAKPARRCDYIKPDGHFCGSLALRGRDYCYFHLTCVGRKLRAEKQHAIMAEPALDLPPLEDINSIQIALMQVGDALTHHRISNKTSGQLIYLLSMAAANLKQGVNFHAPAEPAAEGPSAQPSVRCDAYPSFEADYDLEELSAELSAKAAETGPEEPDAAQDTGGQDGAQPVTELESAAPPAATGEVGTDDPGPGDGAATAVDDYATMLARLRRLEAGEPVAEEELPPDSPSVAKAPPPPRRQPVEAKPAGRQIVVFGLPKPPAQVYENWWKMRQAYFQAECERWEADDLQKQSQEPAYRDRVRDYRSTS